MASSFGPKKKIKVVLFGDSGTGAKTSLATRFAEGTFDSFVISTIGAVFLTQSVMLEEKWFPLELWDLAGQERYQSLAGMYMRGAHAIVLGFSFNDRHSFEFMEDRKRIVDEHCSSEVVQILVGNKSDLIETHGEVSRLEGRQLAEKLGLSYFETSAKTGENVNEVFVTLVREVLAKEAEAVEAFELYEDVVREVEGFDESDLDLTGRRLGAAPEAVMALLGEALAKNTRVKNLWLSLNQLGTAPEAVMRRLAEALAKNTSVEGLLLDSNRLGTAPEAVMARLTEMLARSTTLKLLNLNNNQLGAAPEAVVALLGETLAKNTSINELWLGANLLGAAPEAVMARLAEALAKNTSVKELKLNHNELSSLSWLISPLGANPLALEVLDVSNNKLAEFPAALCALLPELRVLWFADFMGEQDAASLLLPRELILHLPLQCHVYLPKKIDSLVAGLPTAGSTDGADLAAAHLIPPELCASHTGTRVVDIARSVLFAQGGLEAEWQHFCHSASSFSNDGAVERINLPGLTDAGAQSLARALPRFPQLKRLLFRHNNVSGDDEHPAIGDCGLQALASFLLRTNDSASLTELDLWGNSFGNDGLRSLGQALARNKTLTALDIGGNRGLKSIAGLVPESSEAVLSLKRLSLTHSSLADFPGALCSRLPELELLDLSNGQSICLPAEIDELPRGCLLFLANCTAVHLGSQDSRDIKDFWKSSTSRFNKSSTRTVAEVSLIPLYGETTLHPPTQLRLMVVGNAGAGKTTLIEALLQNRGRLGDAKRIFQGTANRRVTFGVDVLEWVISEVLKFSCWDFAGQIQYHSAHKSFLSRDALYLLAFNAAAAAQGGLDEAIRYLETWLDLLAACAPGARVVIVGTNTRTRTGYVVPELAAGHHMLERLEERVAALIARAPRVRVHAEMLLVDGLHHENCRALRRVCETLGGQLLEERDRLPEEIFGLGREVKKAAASRPIMSLADFSKLLGDSLRSSSLPAGFTRFDLFAQAMHQWGWIVQIENLAVGASKATNMVVLDPQWLAKCLACVVDGLEPRQRAVVTRQELEKVWRKRVKTTGKRAGAQQALIVKTLVEIMKKFDLAFVQNALGWSSHSSLDDFSEFVLPSLLPSERPLRATVNAEKILAGAPRAVSRRYTFPIFPSGLLSQLFVRLHALPQAVLTGWREGLYIEFQMESGPTVAVRAELVDGFAIHVRASVINALQPFQRCLVTLVYDLVQRDDDKGSGAGVIAVECNGEGLALDPISGDVVSSMLEPVEFLADADVVVGPNIASGQFGEVVQVRTTSANPGLPANAVFALKRPIVGKKEEYDVEFEVMRHVENCGHLVGVVAYQRQDARLLGGVGGELNSGMTAGNKAEVDAGSAASSLDNNDGPIIALLMPLFDSSLSFVLKGRFESLDVFSWYSVKDIANWLLQISHGMRYLHAKGYAHLDLKTRNVMVRFRGSGTVESLAVGDFGESIFVGDSATGNADAAATAVASSGASGAELTYAAGSLGHRAPEVLAASESSPVRGTALFHADVYSFGTVASVCVSGIAIGEMLGDDWRAPCSGKSVRPPGGADSGDWDGLRGLISWCLETSGAERPSFAELAEGGLALPAPRRQAVQVDTDECTRREAGTQTSSRKDWKQRALRAEDENVRMRGHVAKAEAEAVQVRLRAKDLVAQAEADTRKAEDRATQAEAEAAELRTRLAAYGKMSPVPLA